MKMRRRGFTLIELMTVMAILAILMTIFLPVMKSVKGAAFKWSAGQSVQQLGQAMTLYASDADDGMVPALYGSQYGYQTWFGLQQADGTFDVKQGLLSPYTKGRAAHDPILFGKPYLGDGSGFGYNWGYLGSDMHITGIYARFPNCDNPARMTEVEHPSSTIEFATSSYYFADWLPRGDGQTYDFGFIDPPKYWHGNPNVDFGTLGTRKSTRPSIR